MIRRIKNNYTTYHRTFHYHSINESSIYPIPRWHRASKALLDSTKLIHTFINTCTPPPLTAEPYLIAWFFISDLGFIYIHILYILKTYLKFPVSVSFVRSIVNTINATSSATRIGSIFLRKNLRKSLGMHLPFIIGFKKLHTRIHGIGSIQTAAYR